LSVGAVFFLLVSETPQNQHTRSVLVGPCFWLEQTSLQRIKDTGAAWWQWHCTEPKDCFLNKVSLVAWIVVWASQESKAAKLEVGCWLHTQMPASHDPIVGCPQSLKWVHMCQIS